MCLTAHFRVGIHYPKANPIMQIPPFCGILKSAVSFSLPTADAVCFYTVFFRRRQQSFGKIIPIIAIPEKNSNVPQTFRKVFQ